MFSREKQKLIESTLYKKAHEKIKSSEYRKQVVSEGYDSWHKPGMEHNDPMELDSDEVEELGEPVRVSDPGSNIDDVEAHVDDEDSEVPPASRPADKLGMRDYSTEDDYEDDEDDMMEEGLISEGTISMGAIRKTKKYLSADKGVSDSEEITLTTKKRSSKPGQDAISMIGVDSNGKEVVDFGSHASVSGAKKFFKTNFNVMMESLEEYTLYEDLKKDLGGIKSDEIAELELEDGEFVEVSSSTAKQILKSVSTSELKKAGKNKKAFMALLAKIS